MRSQEVNRMLRRLNRDLAEVDRRRKVIVEAIQGLEGLQRENLVEEAPAPTGKRRGATRDSVVAVVSAANGPITDQKIAEQLTQRGLMANAENPLHATRAALSRLVREGVLERVARSTYELAKPEQEAGALKPVEKLDQRWPLSAEN